MLDSRLRYAVAVARLGSFSGASESVGVTQSAVTKSVADLEQQLGFALFHRTSRGAVPTPEGREFIDRAARLLADAADLFSERDRGADPYSGQLRVGLFPGSIDWLITAPVIALLRRHAGLRIDIAAGNSERGVQLLSRGDIDVALGLEAAFTRWPQFKCGRIAVVKIVPFVRTGHPILTKARIGKAALAQFEFVMPSSSEPYMSIIQQLYEQTGQRPSDRIHTTDHFPLVRRIVASSDAIGMVAMDFTTNKWFRDNFVALPDSGLLDPLMLCYATRTRWPIKPAARALINQIRLAWAGSKAD
ncbi:MAG: LysR family transcriptional regulator [Sphingomicrobium sp.]